MKDSGRYDVSNLTEARYEPGSDGQVLKNRLAIKTEREMDVAEARALETAMDQLVRSYDEDDRFTASDIREFHQIWLTDIYEWAGKYCQVNLSKDDFPFAAAARVPGLMADLEKGALKQFTPCGFEDRAEVVKALAEVHTELVLIHPFRDGNGRVARILSTLMALQAGLPLLDFSQIAGEGKEDYFSAVRAGMHKDYRPMEAVFARIINRTIESS